MSSFDVAIIGAGPAGLAAAARFTETGLRVALIDAGKPVGDRGRDVVQDMTRGHGGAGLFSDGKFSFFPSASELWSLPRDTDLRAAYDWTCEQLEDAGLSTPPFPEDPGAYTVGAGEWVLKHYPSDYLSLDARLKLIAGMVAAVDAEVLTETEVVQATPSSTGIRLHVRTPRGSADIQARRALVATGRFGPLALRELTGEQSFHRLEVGFRIEQPAQQAFFRDMPQLDPKLRFRESGDQVEWRTFCACRNGEAVLTETQGLWTVSGRSDCPPTGRSNVGFNTRILDEAIAARALAPALRAMAHPESHFTEPLLGLLEGRSAVVAVFDRVYGVQLRELMTRGLLRLAERFPDIRNARTRLIGPTLEGVGWYPKLDRHLRVPGRPVWVAGDACGRFRGIVAAMISGYHVAAAVAADLEAA